MRYEHPVHNESPKLYDRILYVLFTVKGKNLNERDPKCIDRVNGFLRLFRQKLESLRVEENGLIAVPQRVDSFIAESIDTTTILCSQTILWTVKDSSSNRADNFNWGLNRLLGNMVKDQVLDNGLSYSKKLTAEVTDIAFQGERKRGRWPEERLTVISY